jgi:hypothetical protein
VALACAAGAAGPAPAESAGDAIRRTAAPPEIRSGGTSTLTGALVAPDGAPLAGVPVELQADPYPYRGFFDASHTTTAADGSFAFALLRPDRNTRYRVRTATGLSRPLDVYVDAPAVLHVYNRGPGRAMLTMLSYHSAYFHWGGVKAYWYVARLGSRSFQLTAITRTRELRPGVTYATATVNPPARRFAYRVCFDAPRQAGSGPPAAHAPCPRR